MFSLDSSCVHTDCYLGHKTVVEFMLHCFDFTPDSWSNKANPDHFFQRDRNPWCNELLFSCVLLLYSFKKMLITALFSSWVVLKCSTSDKNLNKRLTYLSTWINHSCSQTPSHEKSDLTKLLLSDRPPVSGLQTHAGTHSTMCYHRLKKTPEWFLFQVWNPAVAPEHCISRSDWFYCFIL